MSRKLTLADIQDARAYERERAATRAAMATLKACRRVHVGPLVTMMFENRETVRYQIQEMARVERILTDEGILDELAAYNPLVPEPGQLRATLFIELTTDEQMRRWLPAMVGIERHALLRLPNGRDVPCTVDPQHASQLTREHVTAAVHYIGFDLSADEVAAFGVGARLAIDLPAYREETELSPATVAELRADLGA